MKLRPIDDERPYREDWLASLTARRLADDTHLPVYLFSPVSDRGVMVTPFYWGSHWPLARGNSTGWAVDDRISLTPANSSVIGWGLNGQTPLCAFDIESIDTLGHSKLMNVQSWVWLIGATDDPDFRLLEWARSFSKPPSLELRGVRLDTESYALERPAIRLVVEDETVSVSFRHDARYVNPVFDMHHAPKRIDQVRLGTRPPARERYAWDGRALWTNANIDDATPLQIRFQSNP